jgi:hypothetical protein
MEFLSGVRDKVVESIATPITSPHEKKIARCRHNRRVGVFAPELLFSRCVVGVLGICRSGTASKNIPREVTEQDLYAIDCKKMRS